jgi:predicted transcriptional regulator of viral defense system
MFRICYYIGNPRSQYIEIMSKTVSALIESLLPIAEQQNGFITAAQALEAGVDRPGITRLVKQGFLERQQRALYRLSHFPQDDNADLWRAVLWPVLDKTSSGSILGTLCLETALSLYDVSTINPNKIDIALPGSVRFRREIPSDIIIHPRVYPTDAIVQVKGLPTTTLFRTLADLIADRRSLQFVDEALEVANSRALITSRDDQTLRAMRVLDSRVSFILA